MTANFFLLRHALHKTSKVYFPLLSCVDELVYRSKYSPTTENIIKVKQQKKN